jgi:hypothetical protein
MSGIVIFKKQETFKAIRPELCQTFQKLGIKIDGLNFVYSA